MKGRIVKSWIKNNGRYIKPASTESFAQWVERKIHDKGDELEGLNAAVASLRYRVVKQRERAERKVA
jgi:hypothetical protein